MSKTTQTQRDDYPVTAVQVAAYLGQNESTIRRRVYAGDIGRLGRTRFLSAKSAAKYVGFSGTPEEFHNLCRAQSNQVK